MNPTEASRILEAEVLKLLQSNPGKKYRTSELAKIFADTTTRMRIIVERLAGKKSITEHSDSLGRLYSSLEAAPKEQVRTFIMKPHKFDKEVLDKFQKIRDERDRIKSKFDL